MSRACKYLGYSRDTFYRYKEFFEEGGEEALRELSRKTPNIKNRVEASIETRVVAIATEYPAYGICECFHRTMQDEFYAVAFRKKIYKSIEELQQDVDLWLEFYNKERTHSGKYCYGKTPMQTWKDSLHLTKEKLLETHYQNFIPLSVSGEVKTGSAGEQPASNNPTYWNGLGNENSPTFKTISRIYDLKKQQKTNP